MLNSRWTYLMRCAAGLTAGIALGAPAPAPAESVTFSDMAAGGGAGFAYQRVRSPIEAIADAIRAQPLVTMEDFALKPFKGRGAPGVAVLDFDGDGDLDLYVTNGPGAANSLFSSQLQESGELSFVDLAQMST